MEKEEKKSIEKKVVEKNTTEKSKKDLSNKAQIYEAWKAGETDTVKLRKLTKDSVKIQTVRGWTNRWKNGKGLPKGIKA